MLPVILTAKSDRFSTQSWQIGREAQYVLCEEQTESLFVYNVDFLYSSTEYQPFDVPNQFLTTVELLVILGTMAYRDIASKAPRILHIWIQ
jgi:hypothetical protein